MLITGTGEIFGAVSGGCLEADIVCRAKDVLRSGENSLVIYDVENKDDRVLALILATGEYQGAQSRHSRIESLY